MAEQNKPKFTFESKGLDKDTFHVVRFKGTEGLSTIYRFEVTLISDKADVDITTALQNPAVFTIKRDDGDIPFNGILSDFEQLQESGKHYFYRAVLVPSLWWATLTQHNQIFLNKNVQGFLTDVLTDAGLKQGLGYDFKLQGSYPTWEYICQYNESHFNFVSRWAERDGLYYYFEQSDQGEKMVITDTHISHTPMPEGTQLTYSPPTNLDHAHREEVVKNFMLKQQPLPKKVLLKDYNYRKPSLEMKAEATVSSSGHGEIYIYGEHFLEPSDGQKLAQIRAQEFLCREKVYHGTSTVPYVRTGYVFELKDHFRNDFNQRYLTTEVTHEGSQEAYLVSGLGLHLTRDEDRLYYRNTFSCIPADTQFRAERRADKPKFAGSMNAKIDASGSGQYAELDSQGRYKVILPLDVSGRSGGKATTWLRMAQPYGGSDHGMHFPLHKGTEVLLTCIDGDPDRPIIQAAVPNPETPSQVSDANQTQSRITTGGQNKIHIEDMEGQQRILLHSPSSNTWIRMGSPNDPPEGGGEEDGESEKESGWSKENEGGKYGYKLNTKDHIEVLAGSEASTILGNEFSFVGGSSEQIVAGNDTKIFLVFKEDIVAGLETGLKMGGELQFTPLHTVLHGEELHTKAEIAELTGAKETMEGEIASLRGEHSDMVATVTALEGEKNVLQGQVDTLRGNQTSLRGNVEDLQGASTRLEGEVSSVRGAVNSLDGEVSRVRGDVNNVDGAVNQIRGEITRIDGEVSRIDGEVNNIAAEENTISALIIML